MSNSKSSPQIMTCDFEISGTIIKEAFEMFAVAQAKVLGLRGYIAQVNDDTYKGELQGEGKVIEAFKKLIAAAGEYVVAIKEFIIRNLKCINDYTYETFEVRRNQRE